MDTPPCPAIIAAVDVGILKPVTALDREGEEITVYVPTELSKKWFGVETPKLKVIK